AQSRRSLDQDHRPRAGRENGWPLGPPSSRVMSDRRVAVRQESLSVDEAIALVAHPGAGGIAVFLGVVRDTSDGRSVTRLQSEAYGWMASAEMDRIRVEIESEISGVRLAALHRVGSLDVGDVAVVCAASAPHRGEAFRACRLMIDRLKERVPIWKREHGPDGP